MCVATLLLISENMAEDKDDGHHVVQDVEKFVDIISELKSKTR